MIRTKQPQIINAQTGQSEIVYFELGQRITDYSAKKVLFTLDLGYLKNENNLEIFQKIGETNIITFEEETFNNDYGHLTQLEFDNQREQLMIEKIEATNNYVATGDENYIVQKFWSLTALDLEIVI